jgi:RNA recognition motif-containing protein
MQAPPPTGQNPGSQSPPLPSAGSPQPHPALIEDNTNIYIANLDISINKEILEQIFAPFGKIRESKVLTDLASGRTKGAALLRYEGGNSAEAAIAAMNGTVLPGTSMPLIVKAADSAAEKNRKKARFIGGGRGGGYPGAPGGGGRGRGGYPFAPYPGGGRGYESPPTADPGFPAASPYPPTPGAGSPVPSSVAVYIANLPPEADEGFLYKLFGIYGAIASVRIIRDPGSNMCKGYGFVNYLRYEDAQNSILNMHGYQLGDKFLQVKFKTDKVGSYGGPPGGGYGGGGGFAPAFIAGAGGGGYPPPQYAAGPSGGGGGYPSPAYGAGPGPAAYGNLGSPGAPPMGGPGPYRPF